MSGNFGEELGGSPVDAGGGGSDTDSDTDSEDIGGDDLQAGTDPSAGTGGSDDDDLDIGGGADGDLQSGTDPSAGTGGPPEDDGFDPDPPSTNTGGFGGGGGGLLDDEIDSSVGNADDSGSSSSSPGEFPSPEEVNETVQESDTAQQDTDLTDTSSGSAQDNFSEETEEATPTGAEAPEQDEPTLQNAAGVDNFGQFVGRDISNARDVFISEQTERIASQNENVQASEIDSITLEETENGYQAVATVEQAPVFTNTTGTGFGGGRGRPGGPPVDTRTIATDQVSSIDLGGDSQGADGAGVPDAPADDSQTAPGGSFPDAPEAVGGGFAPPSEAAAAEGSPLAGTDEAVGRFVDTAVETVENSPVADAGAAIADASRGAAGFANRNVVSPAAGFIGERVDVGQQLLGTGGRIDPETGEVEIESGGDIGNPFDLQAETDAGQATAAVAESGGRAATGATLGAPAGVVETTNIAGQGLEFTGEAVADEGLQEGVTEAGEATVDTAQATGSAFVRQAQRNPLQTGAALLGGLGGGAAVTPLRLTRTDVPTRGGGDTTVRGLRAEPPAITRPLTSDRNIQGRTLAGTTGGRPQVGTPTVDLENVDIERAGTGTAQSGAVFEPQRPFETDVFTASAPSAGETATERVRATQALLGEGDTLTGGAATQDVAPVTDVLERTRELGEDVDTEAVAEALDESDATVFGSGAVAAQAPEFRDPGDIDIVVPDKDAATERLEDALAGSDTSTEAFDIKTAEDFGGLEGGEVFGFGRRSQDPVETPEGVGVNPIGEELQRKTGASAFFRGPDIGEEGVDVGPRPVRGPDTPTRQKDVRDAAAIAESMSAEPSTVRQFREAFDLETTGATPPSGARRLLPENVRALAADTRGQAGLVGAGRGGDVDVPRRPRDTETETTPTPARGGEPDRPRSPAVDGDGGRSVPVFSPGGGGGFVGSEPPATGPTGQDSPSPPGGSDTPPSGLPDGPFFGGGSTVPPTEPPTEPPSTPPSVPPGLSETPSTPPSTPPDEPPGGGGFTFNFGLPDLPGQPPRRTRLEIDTEPDQQEAETEIFATGDTFASGILSAEDVLDT